MVTELGLAANAMLAEYFKYLINISFSANLEEQLDDITENKITKEQLLHNFYTPFAEDLERAREKILPAVEPPPEVTDIPCEKCGSLMVVKEGRYGKFLACPAFPKCRCTKPIVKKIGVSCPVCGGELTERKTRTGKIFYGCEKYPECEYTTWDLPLQENCPKCGHMLVEHTERSGRKRKYCSNPECADARPVRPAAAREKTADQTAVKAVKKAVRGGRKKAAE